MVCGFRRLVSLNRMLGLRSTRQICRAEAVRRLVKIGLKAKAK